MTAILNTFGVLVPLSAAVNDQYHVGLLVVLFLFGFIALVVQRPSLAGPDFID
ncbi:MAG: hypothetical protein MZU97_00085 [Bacillus subtilis]|nr:hypothetical protein [Bacillus subtilis]